MFMTGHEIQGYAASADFPKFAADRGWSDKLREAKTPGWQHAQMGERPLAALRGRRSSDPSLHDQVKAEGVQKPVNISHRDSGPVLADGHHRVAAAADLGQYVPVSHSRLAPPEVLSPSQWNHEEM